MPDRGAFGAAVYGAGEGFFLRLRVELAKGFFRRATIPSVNYCSSNPTALRDEKCLPIQNPLVNFCHVSLLLQQRPPYRRES